jgi:hypothetical protein
MADYTCCFSVASERPNENTFTFTHVPSPLSVNMHQDSENGDEAAPVLITCSVTSVQASQDVQWRARPGDYVVWNRCGLPSMMWCLYLPPSYTRTRKHIRI